MTYTEKLIVKRAIKALLKAGYKISVNYKTLTILTLSASRREIFAAMDDGYGNNIVVYERLNLETARGWVEFFYGGKTEVISGYSPNLEQTLAPAFALATKLEE